MAATTHMDYYGTDDPSSYEKGGHSGFGIASFVIACLAGMFELAVIVYAGLLQTTTPGGMDENSPQVIVIGLAAIGGMALDLLAIGLGVAGLFQRGRSKTFAVLGVVLGTVILLGMIGLIVLGIAMGS
jgi:mannose/fructose/N-acetylgalactosamine-specific phosphotransferase system component IIC